jgi:hypothetical protein
MLKLVGLVCGAALLVSACASHPEGVAYDGGVYYDDFYGPYYDGYWGPDGFFYFSDGFNHFHRDDGGHFRHDGRDGFHSVGPRTADGRGSPGPALGHGFGGGEHFAGGSRGFGGGGHGGGGGHR